MSNWWDDAPVAEPLSAASGRAVAEATDPRFAPGQKFTPADDNWWKMAPVADRPALEQAGRFATLVPQGINQGLYGAASFLPDISGWLSQKAGLVPQGTPLPSQINTGAGQKALGYDYNPNVTPENTAEKTALSGGEALGSVAATAVPGGIVANSMRTGVGAAVPTYGQTVAKTLAAQPGMQVAATTAGNVTSDLTGNPLYGMGASLALPAAAHSVVRVPFSAPATTGAETERRALLATGKAEGILPSFGNIIDSGPAKMFESVLSKLPFMGNAQAKLIEGNKTAFNKAALDKIPAVMGEGLDAATPGTIDMIKARVGKQFNALEDKTTVNIDPQFGADIANAKADFSKQLRDQMPPSITRKLDELLSAADALKPAPTPKPGASSLEKYPSTDVGPYLGEQPKPNPQPNTVSVDGETYKNIRSKLSAMLTSTTGTDRQAVGAMINALDGAVERSLPKDMVQDWKDARTSWRRISMIGDSVEARHNGETAVGNIPPGALDARTGGDKDMARLAQAGVKYVGDKTPDSGTASRMFFQNMLGLGAGAGAGAAFPLTTALTAGGAYGTNLLLNNPYTRAALIARLQNSREGVLNKGLVATLAGQQALGQSR